VRLKKIEVLNQLEDKQIDYKRAYHLLYPNIEEKKPGRAHFIKVKIKIPDQTGVNVLLSVLLVLPIPIWLIRMIIRRRNEIKFNDDFKMDPKDLIDLISLKGVKVMIKASSNERIYLKTI